MDRAKDWLLEQTVCRSCGDNSSNINTSDTLANTSSKPVEYVTEGDIASNSGRQTAYRFLCKNESSSEIHSNQKSDHKLNAKQYNNILLNGVTVSPEIQTVCKSCGDNSKYSDTTANTLKKQKVTRSCGDSSIYYTSDIADGTSSNQTDC